MQATYQPQSKTRSNGFALVLALSLMAFIVLLLLSITTLVRVETAVSSKALEKLHAEENARLALMIALGELQRYAGPDQRVTARADILDPDSANPFWTGVWDTTQPTAAPRRPARPGGTGLNGRCLRAPTKPHLQRGGGGLHTQYCTAPIRTPNCSGN